MRKRFDEQLALLNKELIEMGALCEDIIKKVSDSLETGNVSLAEEARGLEDEIDQTERNIESLCLKLLLKQQPVAGDLRLISSALKMITDMERIGDQASDIAEIVKYVASVESRERECICLMAKAAMKMVTASVEAFVKRDLNLAREAIESDDVVDRYFYKIKKSLIQMVAKEPGEGEYALDLLMISKYFERIGDHAVNIAEWVVFSVTGVHKTYGDLEVKQ